MARYANADWDLPWPKVEDWQQAQVAVLMDIRDELRRLNTLLHCSNFVTLPATVRAIERKIPARPSRQRKAQP